LTGRIAPGALTFSRRRAAKARGRGRFWWSRWRSTGPGNRITPIWYAAQRPLDACPAEMSGARNTYGNLEE